MILTIWAKCTLQISSRSYIKLSIWSWSFVQRHSVVVLQNSYVKLLHESEFVKAVVSL